MSIVGGAKPMLKRISPVLALAALGLIFAVGQARAQSIDGTFSLFGQARKVIGGTGPNNAAVDLTSNCGGVFSPTCYTSNGFTYSGLALKSSSGTTVAGITTLSSDYNFGGANCG